VYELLCMGLQCLVYGKNAGVLVFYVWVAWRRCWEGNGAEGCLRLKERMVILCCDSNNGERMKFVVFVYGSVFGFWKKFWVCCGWFFLGVWVCCGWMGCLPMGFGLHRAWEHRLQSTRSTRKKTQHKIYAIIITTN
jgi:hypothetical protein